MTSNAHLQAYREGWIDGAGFKPFVERYDDQYGRGYDDGREAFRDAMRKERARLEMPEPAVVTLQSGDGDVS